MVLAVTWHKRRGPASVCRISSGWLCTCQQRFTKELQTAGELISNLNTLCCENDQTWDQIKFPALCWCVICFGSLGTWGAKSGPRGFLPNIIFLVLALTALLQVLNINSYTFSSLHANVFKFCIFSTGQNKHPVFVDILSPAFPYFWIWYLATSHLSTCIHPVFF